MNQTKEQLLIEITKLRQSHADWVSGDEKRRKEFAKAFNWYKEKDYGYGNMSAGNTELRVPSWEEVFVQVGKLLAAKTFYDLDGNVSECEWAIEDIKKELAILKEKNL